MKTKNYLKERLFEVENMLHYSARIADNLFIDDMDKHTQERLELLRERMYLITILKKERGEIH